MPSERLPLTQTKLVSPRALKAYAEALDWRPVGGVNHTIAIYHRPDSELHQLTVPLNESYDDYAETVAEAVLKLAAYESRRPLEVLDHLLLPPADELRFREVSPETETCTLSLQRAEQLISGAKRAILAVAHSVLVPQHYHPRMSRTEAEVFLARCRMAQTERGSFTLTIACVLDFQQGLFDPKVEPFARRVTALFMQSLSGLANAAESASMDAMLDLDRHPGLSANLCEALSMIRPEGERSYLSVAATWSRAFLPHGTARNTTVQVRQEAFDAAAALGTRLRSLPKPRVDRFYGFVEVLKGQPSPSESRPAGEVRFLLFDQEEEIHASATLNSEYYALAGEAHLATALVSFKGVLQRLPRLNRIVDISDLKLIAFDEDDKPPAPHEHQDIPF